MKAFTSLSIILASMLAGKAQAGPLGDRAAEATVTICRNANLDGCEFYLNIGGGCTNVNADINDQTSSLDTGGAGCTFFQDGGCSGASIEFAGTFNTIPANWNDIISSFHC